MRYLALATDYDGTLAHDGHVDEATIEALERLRAAGRRLLLVTGRELPELLQIFPQIDLFERVVAENGALLYHPARREEKLLSPEPPAELVARLRAEGAAPLSVGRSIVATVEPFHYAALEAIHELGLELHLIFNKGSVMILPSGINKVTGLTVALNELGLSRHNVVGVGDAENDHAFLSFCSVSVAVANALPSIKERADIVTQGARGAGVVELIDWMLNDDLSEVAGRLSRHSVLVGKRPDGGEERINPLRSNFLVAGTSGSGKSTLTTGLLERMEDAGYHYAIIDPEGDYAALEGAVTLGDAAHPPVVQEVLDVLKKPNEDVVINLLGVPLADRPEFFNRLLPHLLELRARTGRPHFIVIDEVHHLLPAARGPDRPVPPPPTGMLYITVHPESVDPEVLKSVGALMVVGQTPDKTTAAFCQAIGCKTPAVDRRSLQSGEVLFWRPGSGQSPVRIQSEPLRSERRRHSRKYAEGNVGGERNFVFTGPQGKLNLRAQNLAVFLQMADGVDDETWQHHLKRGDYSRWFREAIKDEGLADEATEIEGQPLPLTESRAAIRAAVQRRYTLPADKPSGEITRDS